MERERQEWYLAEAASVKTLNYGTVRQRMNRVSAEYTFGVLQVENIHAGVQCSIPTDVSLMRTPVG